MSTVQPSTTDVRALAAAIRDGEQRECLITLLHSVGTAVTLAPRAQEIYPDNDGRALGYLVGVWAPVIIAWRVDPPERRESRRAELNRKTNGPTQRVTG